MNPQDRIKEYIQDALLIGSVKKVNKIILSPNVYAYFQEQGMIEERDKPRNFLEQVLCMQETEEALQLKGEEYPVEKGETGKIILMQNEKRYEIYDDNFLRNQKDKIPGILAQTR